MTIDPQNPIPPAQPETAPTITDSIPPKIAPQRSFWGGVKISIALFLLLALPAGLLTKAFFAPVALPDDLAKNIVIPKNSSVDEIAAILEKESVTDSDLSFRLLALALAQNRLHAGEYRISNELLLSDVVLMMRAGETVVRKITIPEGLTSHEIAAFLRAEETLSGILLEDPEEGALLPETYHYSFGDERGALIARMAKARRELLAKLWAERASDLPLQSPDEAVVMASLIEKETGKKVAERPRVAGVFYNRLRANMRLQSDPTVIYAITKGTQPLGRSLTREDLETPSPYNTYTTAGLPPKPICNPGKASLIAALKPEKHGFYYFVADGTGGHAFGLNLDDHNRNVQKWIKTLRK